MSLSATSNEGRSSWSMTRGTSSSDVPASLTTPISEPASFHRVPYVRAKQQARIREVYSPSTEPIVESVPIFRDESNPPAAIITPPSQLSWTTPADGSPINTPPQPRRSAKELISMYETSSTQSSPTRHPYTPRKRLNQNLPAIPQPKKGLPQLRESFRNLFSVFGKSAKRKSYSGDSDPVPEGFITKLTMVGRPARPAQEVKRQPVSVQPTLQGTLLFLDQDMPMILWHRCAASFYPPNILLTWSALSGQSFSHTLALVECSDVRSVAASTIEEGLEPDLDGSVAHVFELEFEGGQCQRLAAASAKERGGWVSAIWDAILALQTNSLLVDDQSVQDVVHPNSLLRVANPDSDTTSMWSGSSSPKRIPSPTPPGLGVSSNSPRISLQRIRYPESARFASSAAQPATSQRGPHPHALPRRPPVTHSIADSTRRTSIGSLDKMTTVQQRVATIRHKYESASRSPPPPPPQDAKKVTSPHHTPSTVDTPRTWVQGSIMSHNGPPSASGSLDPDLRRKSVLLNSRLTNSHTSSAFSSQTLDGLPPPPPTSHAMLRKTSKVPFQRFVLERRPQEEIRVYGNLAPQRTNQHVSIKHATRDTASTSAERSGFNGFQSTNWERENSNAQSPGSDTDGESNYVSSQSGIQPLYDLVRNIAVENTAHREVIEDHINNFKAELKFMVEDIKNTFPLAADPANEITTSESASADRIDSVPSPLEDLRRTMEELVKGIEAMDVKGLREKLEGMKADLEISDLQGNLSRLHDKVDFVTAQTFPTTTHNLPTSSADTGTSPAMEPDAELHKKVDALPGQLNMDAIHAKLDEVYELCQALMSARSDITANDKSKDQEISEPGVEGEVAVKPTPARELDELLELLKGERAQREQQLQHQGDAVRYLHELNAWMDQFVTNTYGSGSQFQVIATGIEQLCKDIGVPIGPMSDSPPDQTAADNPTPPSIGVVLKELHQFVNEERTKEGDAKQTHDHITKLVEEVGTDVKTLVQTEGQANEAVLAAISNLEKQQQQHDILLRSIAAELSTDIKGERVRFIEAMQEATSVNVQMHVDEFKKLLANEVMSMIGDVGQSARNQEREVLEHGIGGLFAHHRDPSEPLDPRILARRLTQVPQEPQAKRTRTSKSQTGKSNGRLPPEVHAPAPIPATNIPPAQYLQLPPPVPPSRQPSTSTVRRPLPTPFSSPQEGQIHRSAPSRRQI